MHCYDELYSHKTVVDGSLASHAEIVFYSELYSSLLISVKLNILEVKAEIGLVRMVNLLKVRLILQMIEYLNYPRTIITDF